MKCPKCGRSHPQTIVDTRDSTYGKRRRRKCGACGHRFTTAEIVVQSDNPQTKVRTRLRRAVLTSILEETR